MAIDWVRTGILGAGIGISVFIINRLLNNWGNSIVQHLKDGDTPL